MIESVSALHTVTLIGSEMDFDGYSGVDEEDDMNCGNWAIVIHGTPRGREKSGREDLGRYHGQESHRVFGGNWFE